MRDTYQSHTKYCWLKMVLYNRKWLTLCNAELLVPIGTQKSRAPPVWLTHVEGLTVCPSVGVDAGEVLLVAVEARVGDVSEDWVVSARHPRDGVHHHLSVGT